MKQIHYLTCAKILGMPCQPVAERTALLEECKRQLRITARNGDSERFKLLTQIKQRLRPRTVYGKCLDCGVVIRGDQSRCGMHQVKRMHAGKKLKRLRCST